MSDKEKLESIKNGQDVELDGVTVLQSTSFAKEQAEEKKEEVAPSGETKETNNQVEESTDSKQETNNEVNLEPDVKITPDVPSIEVPTEPAIDSQSEVDSAPAPDTTPFTINLDGLNLNNEVKAPSAVTNEPAPEVPTFEQPSQSSSFGFNNFSTNETPINDMTNNFSNSESSSELFNDAYSSVEDNTKTIAAIVTEEDEVNAKNANMQAYEKLYDAGPGKQISILRNFSEEAAKWIRAADKSGFVSGEMHDIAKKILREYQGLKEEQEEFTDDKIIPFKNDYGTQQQNTYNGFSNVSGNNTIQFQPTNNDMDNFNKPFAA